MMSLIYFQMHFIWKHGKILTVVDSESWEFNRSLYYSLNMSEYLKSS